jgi:branched-chain amino acid transport system permease protein
MTALLLVEQTLNGLQMGVMLFLMSAGLTLVFGIMGMINLAHGSLYMMGAYFAAALVSWTGSFFLAVPLAVLAALALGVIVELAVLRTLYDRDHLDQVLATFGLILFFNEIVRLAFGAAPLYLDLPAALSGHVEIVPGAPYPVYRLAIIATGLAVAAALYVLVQRTRAGALIRAGASNREMVGALGIDIPRLFTLVFGLGAALAGLGGAIAGPIVSVQTGMGEDILILAFVVIVVGGIGSVRGAFFAALAIGVIDTMGRAFLRELLALALPRAAADTAGPTLASMLIYMVMAAILFLRPQGLFPPKSR